jgi:hypothetical protein
MIIWIPLLLSSLLLSATVGWSQTPATPSESKVLHTDGTQEAIQFNSVKSVLQKDGLLLEMQRKQVAAKKLEDLKQQERKARFNYPPFKELRKLAIDLWLVKEVARLRWDFDHPDYALTETVVQLFKKMGYEKKTFSLLAIDNPSLPHFAIPVDSQHTLFLYSIPYCRAMDLSKSEIALMLLEDYLRVEKKWVEDFASFKDLEGIAERNFLNSKPDLKSLYSVGEKLSDFVFKKGFSFQQQFEVTKEMDRRLKSHPELWGMYVKLIGKMDQLVKQTQVYENSVQMYPSPQMQLKWLSTEKTQL